MIQKIINILTHASILLLPFYLVRFSVSGIPTNLLEMLIIIAILFWLFKLNKSSAIYSLPKIYWLSFLLIFLGLIISSFLNSNWLSEAGIIKSWFIIPFLFFLLLMDQIDSAVKAKRVLRFFYVLSASVGLISLLYLLNGILTYDGRLSAFYLSPNYLAMFLAPGIIIGFWSLLQYVIPAPASRAQAPAGIQKINRVDSGSMAGMPMEKRPFYFLLFSLAIMLIAFYFTFSYGAWLAVFLSLLITLGLTNFFSRKQKIKFFSAFVFLLLIALIFQLPNKKISDIFQSDPRSSLASRMMIWQSAWKIGTDNPIWGIGPGNFQEKYLEYQKYFPPYLEWAVPQPHNLYLAFWLQTGILGLSGFFILIGYWLNQTAKMLRHQKNNLFQAAPFCVMFYFLLHGLIDTPYWKNDLAVIFWMVLAVGLFFIRQNQAQQMAVRPIDEK